MTGLNVLGGLRIDLMADMTKGIEKLIARYRRRKLRNEKSVWQRKAKTEPDAVEKSGELVIGNINWIYGCEDESTNIDPSDSI